jgi:hypothetical protein
MQCDPACVCMRGGIILIIIIIITITCFQSEDQVCISTTLRELDKSERGKGRRKETSGDRRSSESLLGLYYTMSCYGYASK